MSGIGASCAFVSAEADSLFLNVATSTLSVTITVHPLRPASTQRQPNGDPTLDSSDGLAAAHSGGPRLLGRGRRAGT